MDAWDYIMVEEAEQKLNVIEEAKATAERIEKANVEMSSNITKLEQLQARDILGGRSNAAPNMEKPKEETPKEYAQRVMRGDVSKR